LQWYQRKKRREKKNIKKGRKYRRKESETTTPETHLGKKKKKVTTLGHDLSSFDAENSKGGVVLKEGTPGRKNRKVGAGATTVGGRGTLRRTS